MPYLALSIAVVTNVFGHVLFKAGALAGVDGGVLRSLLALPTLAGAAVYGLSAVAYVIALRELPLSVAMPTMVAGYAGATIAAALLWGEAVGARHVLALVLIAVALVLLHR